MLQCGAEYYENLTNEKVDALVEKLKTSGQRSSYMKTLSLTAKENKSGKLVRSMGKPILLEHINVPGIEKFDVYRSKGGYASVEKAVKTMTLIR